MTSLQIVIVGAGIAGLATALSMSQKTKHGITILEAVRSSPRQGRAFNAMHLHLACSASGDYKNNSRRWQPVQTSPRSGDNFEYLGLIPSNINAYSERV